MDDDLLHKIEAQRAELEVNLTKLRNALRHWTGLELDYEGLKDEFRMLAKDATKTDCLGAAHNFGPQKVDEKELIDLIEPSKGKVRSPAQIVEVLSKRVDYVLRNAESLRKQISDLEKKRNAVLLAAHPEHEVEATLPIAEITEELDDDDNVISSSIQRQGDTAKKVLDVLEKTKSETKPSGSQHKTAMALPVPRIEEIDSLVSDEDAATGDVRTEADQIPSMQLAKDYSRNPHDTEEEAHLRQEMIQYGLGEVGNIVAELELGDSANDDPDEDDETMAEAFDDSEEDQYDEDDSMDDDSEDESGRSKSAVHNDKYRTHIEELQQQLGFKMENLGPSPEPTTANSRFEENVSYLRDSEFSEQIKHFPPEFHKRFSRPSAAEAARKAAIAREEALRGVSKSDGAESNAQQDKRSTEGKKKQVAFAPTLDIAPESTITKPPMMKDMITEDPIVDSQSAGPPKPKQVSRFKAARSVQNQTPTYPPPMDSPARERHGKPSGPAGGIIAQNLVERPGTMSAAQAPPPDGDDFDEELQRRQIAVEHHRLRNRMVHEHGGYVRGGEAENWGEAYSAPNLQDEQTGETVKISRFKAARMRP